MADRWWTDKERLQAAVDEHGNLSRAARAIGGVAPQTLAVWWRKHELPPLRTGHPGVDTAAVNGDEWLIEHLRKAGDRATVNDLADAADVSPRRVREALERLADKGYRVRDDDDAVHLDRVSVPTSINHRITFDGETYRFALVSDVHLGSKHCHLAELHAAYDHIQTEGIDTVYNGGDIVAGLGIYRTQKYDITRHTFEEQVDGAVDEYPIRDGVTTYLVGGNHDLEGAFAHAGANAALAVCNRRDDIVYCGDYDATFSLPQGTRINIRHPQGGKGYAKSYKPQKFAESFRGGEKPHVLALSHYHDAGFFPARGIHIMLAGTFEGSTTLATRVPLGEPMVGFWTVDMTVDDDGTIRRFSPSWHPFFREKL